MRFICFISSFPRQGQLDAVSSLSTRPSKMIYSIPIREHPDWYENRHNGQSAGDSFDRNRTEIYRHVDDYYSQARSDSRELNEQPTAMRALMSSTCPERNRRIEIFDRFSFSIDSCNRINYLVTSEASFSREIKRRVLLDEVVPNRSVPVVFIAVSDVVTHH